MGDRCATLAWNTWRHLEIWYGVGGIGAITHTVNPRLFPDQIAWIINHAEDRLLFVDLTFVPLVEKLAPVLHTIEQVIVLTDAEHMPKTTLANAVAYEEWLAEADGDFAWRHLRREHRQRPVLHLRHHRPSQGRALFASLERASCHDGWPRHDVAHPPTTSSCRSSRCSTPIAGRLRMRHRWSGPLSFCPAPKLDGSSVYELLEAEKRDLRRRRSDDLADAPPASRSRPAAGSRR